MLITKGQQGQNKPLLSDKSGEMYYEIIIKTIIVVVFFLTVIGIYHVFTQYIETNYLCRRVVRAVEVGGSYNSEIHTLFNDLRSELTLPSATMEITNVTYFDSTRKIQLRERFTITVHSTYNITIFSPTFSPPLQIPVTLTSTLSGMSEVYWK